MNNVRAQIAEARHLFRTCPRNQKLAAQRRLVGLRMYYNELEEIVNERMDDDVARSLDVQERHGILGLADVPPYSDTNL
jgi:hypothetical protein